MPDISMCGNEECPSRKKCYRFTAKPTPNYQAYAAFSPMLKEDKCDSFWDNSDREDTN